MQRSKLLMITIPLAIILFGLTVYEYGILQVQADMDATRQKARSQTKILKKYLTLIAEKPYLERQLAALQEVRKGQNAKMFEAQTASVAAAQLQDSVKSVINVRGGTVTAERIEKQEAYDKFRIINVSVDAEVPDIRVLGDVLYALETQTPYLDVKGLDCTIKNITNPKELIVRLKLSGLTASR